jgi:hypothetical protein
MSTAGLRVIYRFRGEVPGVTLAVVRGGETSLLKAYGQPDKSGRSRRKTIIACTNERLGSFDDAPFWVLSFFDARINPAALRSRLRSCSLTWKLLLQRCCTLENVLHRVIAELDASVTGHATSARTVNQLIGEPLNTLSPWLAST